LFGRSRVGFLLSRRGPRIARPRRRAPALFYNRRKNCIGEGEVATEKCRRGFVGRDFRDSDSGAFNGRDSSGARAGTTRTVPIAIRADRSVTPLSCVACFPQIKARHWGVARSPEPNPVWQRGPRTARSCYSGVGSPRQHPRAFRRRTVANHRQGHRRSRVLPTLTTGSRHSAASLPSTPSGHNWWIPAFSAGHRDALAVLTRTARPALALAASTQVRSNVRLRRSGLSNNPSNFDAGGELL